MHPKRRIQLERGKDLFLPMRLAELPRPQSDGHSEGAPSQAAQLEDLPAVHSARTQM